MNHYNTTSARTTDGEPIYYINYDLISEADRRVLASVLSTGEGAES